MRYRELFVVLAIVAVVSVFLARSSVLRAGQPGPDLPEVKVDGVHLRMPKEEVKKALVASGIQLVYPQNAFSIAGQGRDGKVGGRPTVYFRDKAVKSVTIGGKLEVRDEAPIFRGEPWERVSDILGEPDTDAVVKNTKGVSYFLYYEHSLQVRVKKGIIQSFWLDSKIQMPKVP